MRGHLEAAWGYAVESLHLFEDLDCARGQRECIRLMEDLRSYWQPPWASSPTVVGGGLAFGRGEPPAEDGFVARAPATLRARQLIDLAATSEDPVLITGPTGTGKELAARLIHRRSIRVRGPLVAVNCAAIPETVFEREIFGHAVGAFSGAIVEGSGLCERASGGTLLLDEVGELPLSLQVKLLRLLQEGTYLRLGDPIERHVDLRVIAATNADLLDMVQQGLFRADLYYRLQILEVRMPSLLDRPEDILPLADLFTRRATGKQITLSTLCDPEVIRLLGEYHWPGNVRELEGVVRRLCLLVRRGGRAQVSMLPRAMVGASAGALAGAFAGASVGALAGEGGAGDGNGGVNGSVSGGVNDGMNVGVNTGGLARVGGKAEAGAEAGAETAAAPDVGAGIAEPATGVVVERALSLAKCLEVAERGAIERALAIAGGSKTEAARILGISRNTLYAKLRRIA